MRPADEVTASERAMIGVILDERYRVESLIGPGRAGGFVYRARDVATHTPVSVRCPPVPSGSSETREEAEQTFLAEAKELRRICDATSHVERLVGFGIAERHDDVRAPYLLFEWLEGRSLERHLRERKGEPQSIGEAMAILEPAARALAATHALGSAHRDVRPANLWFAASGERTRMKLTQFVLASRVGTSEGEAFAPEYGAPEHFKRSYGAVGPATDVYGLALCVVELVSGKRALEGDDAAELYLATSNLSRRPTLRARGAQVSEAVEAVIARALAVEPKRRWPTVHEFWEALVAAVPELTPAIPSVRPPAEAPASKPPPSSARPGSVPSIWARGTYASLPAVKADDLRLGDSAAHTPFGQAKVDGATKAASERRSSIVSWLAVGALATAGIAIVGFKITHSTKEPPLPPTTTAASAPVVTPSTSTSTTPSASATASASPATSSSATPIAAIPSGEAAVALKPFLTDMVRVPAVTFTMGTDREGKGDGPAHKVTLTKAFYVDRTEVTAEAYGACIEDGACKPTRVHAGEIPGEAWGCNTEKDRPKFPANCVDRAQAAKYCAYASKRLPTEAEWELAARSTDDREFPWGSAPPTRCTQAIIMTLSGDCHERKLPGETGATVDGKSAYGALDMAGNVWEWVSDGYEPYPPSATTDPDVPVASGGRGVLRGGSWDYSVTSAKVTFRLPLAPTTGNVSTGFRCARDAHD